MRNLPRAHGRAGLAPRTSVSSGGMSPKAMRQAAPPGVFGDQRVELSSRGTCSLSSKAQFHQLHGFPGAHVGLLVYQPLPTLLRMCHLKRVNIGTSQTRRSRGHRELKGAQYQEPLGIRKFRAVHPAHPPARPEVQHRGPAGHEQRELSPQGGGGRVRGCSVPENVWQIQYLLMLNT